MSALGELPIGTGQSKRVWRPLESVVAGQGDVDDEHGVAQQQPAAPASPLVEMPRLEIVQWDQAKLRKPLKLFGKTVNWQIRRKLQLDTDAGVMTDENLDDIGEPLAEIANRYEPSRALAARSTELNLVLAIYDYVQETAVKAGHSKQRAIDLERAAAHVRDDVEQPHLAVEEGEVPEL